MRAVEDAQGIKATQLVVDLAMKLHGDNQPFRHGELLIAVSHAVKRGDIIEIIYEVPSMRGRIKSFLLPKGSTLNVPIASVVSFSIPGESDDGC